MVEILKSFHQCLARTVSRNSDTNSLPKYRFGTEEGFPITNTTWAWKSLQKGMRCMPLLLVSLYLSISLGVFFLPVYMVCQIIQYLISNDTYQLIKDYFLHNRSWISPWIKPISNGLDIVVHVIASQLSCHCDVISNRLWRYQQNETRVVETRGRCVKIVVLSSFMDSLCRVRNKIM